jgi:hypothetical protein
MRPVAVLDSFTDVNSESLLVVKLSRSKLGGLVGGSIKVRLQ